MSTKTLMGTDHKIRVDFTLDDWTWLCHTLKDAQQKLIKEDCEDCALDITEVLQVIESGEAIAS